jgi:hypothetical protein
VGLGDSRGGRKLFRSKAVFILALCSISFLPRMASAEVSDEKVRMWIASALEERPAPSDESARASLTERRSSGVTRAAWEKLKECRDAGQSLDLELASAEHYLFIRAFAAEKGEQDINSLPKLYGTVKDGLGPAAQLLQTSDQPTSPPDANVIRWGELGVAAGLLDYIEFTGQDPKPASGGLNQYRLALQGYYDNYVAGADDPQCKVVP